MMVAKFEPIFILGLLSNIVRYSSHLMLWQPLITKTNSSTMSKSLSRISSEDYKRTQQGVPDILLLYLYYRYMVHANNK